MMQRCLALLVGLGLSAAVLAQPKDANGVPKPILNKLTRGVNITRWFCYREKGASGVQLRNFLHAEDFAAFKDLKVKFIRLCISPDVIYRDGKPDAVNLAEVDRGIERLNKAGMLVLWDLHDNGQMKLDQRGKDNEGFIRFWKAIAEHYKGKKLNNLVFELVNEPTFMSNPEVWYALQERAVRAVRAIDSKRTIMVSPPLWSGIDALAAFHPYAQTNLIYTYHCYDPFLFTHQGASWVGDPPRDLKQVPFPASPEAVEKILDKNPAARHDALVSYGKERFNKAYLRARVKKAVDWGKKHKVPLVLGEFGVYPPVATKEDRGRWFKAFAEVIAEFKVANAVWGYDDALGLGRTRNASGNVFWLDPVTLDNLYSNKAKKK